MNTYVLIAESILLLVPLGMLILEAFLSFNNIKGDTISAILNNWAHGKSFFITLAWGIITGHFFLGSKAPLIKDNTMSVVIVALLAVTAALIGCSMKWKKTSRLFQLAILITGIVIGHFAWSMNDFN
jgi:hypothetical protein